MSFEQGAGFRISGEVKRKYVNPQGTFAVLTVEVQADGRKKILEMRAFKDAIGAFSDITQGALVTVTGSVDSEKLTSKDKQPVQIDGRDKWISVLTARKIVIAEKPVAAADDSDISW